MATELQPCPHCGQTKTLEVVAAVDLLCDEDERDAYMHSDSFGVVCSAAKPDGPGGCGAMGGFMPTKEAAAEAWNRRVQPAQVRLHQALTDPENQPNQYGVEFLMHGPKFAFKVGSQQFTLDYEPTEPGEFEFMRDMLIHAFSTFTPDVKTAQEVPLLSDEEITDMMPASICSRHDGALLQLARAVEQAVRAKMLGKEGA